MTASAAWRWSPADRKLGERLLDQQMWCFGCDIRRAEGNLLCAYGFSRLRPPSGASGSNDYRLTTPDGAQVRLWGFGCLWAEAEASVFLRRYEFTPRLPAGPVPDLVWSPTGLPPTPRPRQPEKVRQAAHALARLLAWLADYEDWVMARLGPDYRAACVRVWNKPKTVPPEAMHHHWRALAEKAQGLWENYVRQQTF